MNPPQGPALHCRQVLALARCQDTGGQATLLPHIQHSGWQNRTTRVGGPQGLGTGGGPEGLGRAQLCSRGQMGAEGV